MKVELQALEELTGNLDYLLNEGVAISIADKIRFEFLLNRCIELINEMETH